MLRVGHLRAQEHATRSPRRARRSARPTRPRSRYEGKELRAVSRCRSTARSAQLALFEPARKQSTFVDPADPDAAPIVWQGSWRTLDHVWKLAPHWENFAKVWDLIDYPRLLFNTVAIAVIGMIGTLLSCTLVAYGFARFKFPGRGLLFTLLIATIFLPAAVTIIPTYTIFVKLGWVGDLAAAAGARRSSPTPTTCS